MSEPSKLFSFEFVSLNFVLFFAFCNLSIFYSFFTYLGDIGIPLEWRGFLVGLEPMTAFVLRLAVVPLLHAGNAATVMLASLVMIIVALCSYSVALTVPSLVLLRIFHGAAFVLLVSGSMAMMVHFVPKDKSGQGFGIVSVSVLVPYAVMPLVTERLLNHVQSEAHVYAIVSVLALPGVLLLVRIRPRLQKALAGMSSSLVARPSLAELRANLGQPDILTVLGINLLIFLSYSTVFFFLKLFSEKNGLGDVGAFFSICTLTIIGVRLPGSAMFDKANKLGVLQVFTLLLAVCFGLFNWMGGQTAFYLMAGYYGVCLGVVMPLLNAAMFEISSPRFRGINTNLMLSTMDAGFFLSPYLGGMLLAAGYPASVLFHVCTGLVLTSSLLIFLLRTREGRGNGNSKSGARNPTD